MEHVSNIKLSQTVQKILMHIHTKQNMAKFAVLLYTTTNEDLGDGPPQV